MLLFGTCRKQHWLSYLLNHLTCSGSFFVKQIQQFFPSSSNFVIEEPYISFFTNVMCRYLALVHMFNLSFFQLWYSHYRPSIIICIFPKPKIASFWWENLLAIFCKLIDSICSISDGYCWLTLSSSSRISFSGKAFIHNSLFTK